MNRTEHLLTIVAEEAVEVAKCAAKMLRFGPYDAEPGKQVTNLGRLHQELCDLAAAVEMLAEVEGLGNALRNDSLRALYIGEKKAKVERFLAYSRQIGTLQP